MNMDKLAALEDKFLDLEQRISDPEMIARQAEWQALVRQHAQLEPVVGRFREYRARLQAAEEAEAELRGGDAEMAELAQEELATLRPQLAEDERELTLMLLPKDPRDEKNIFLEIRAGAGGEEAALFAAVLLRMYQHYAAARGFTMQIVDANATELGGFKEVTAQVSGHAVYSRLKFESGVHRVQRVPETEAQGRIHTSTATVAVMPEADEIDFELDMNEVKVDTFRAGGAGGQYVNKTESAVRMTHLPTGIVAQCQDEKSQLKNREKCMQVLRSRLYEKMVAEQQAAEAAERRSQVGTGDRSERIRTYNYPQGRVTDHRIGLTLYKLEAFLNGDMDEMIDALVQAKQAEQLAGQQS